jgi:hypothetical protein
MAILKSSKEGRERMLDWFAAVVERNKERGKMQVDTLVIASDGFMLNVSAVLLNLSEPFMDPYGPKLGTIDIDYFTKTKRLTINDETRLALNLEETKEGTKRRLAELQNQMTDVENPINFITECFYFGVRSLHFGMLRAFPRYENQVRKLNEHKLALKNLTESRPQWIMVISNIIATLAIYLIGFFRPHKPKRTKRPYSKLRPKLKRLRSTSCVSKRTWSIKRSSPTPSNSTICWRSGSSRTPRAA